MTLADRDRQFMEHAARLGLRGHGGAEPNPMVGCLIVAPDGSVVGEGYHRRCGGPHAEINALSSAGAAARGATAYVTLEPCNHHGRTGPCTAALIEAGVCRVCVGVRDPHPDASGGMDALEAAGIRTVLVPVDAATRLTAPFIQRARTGLPWIIAKWAQTIDGRVATRTGASRWISGERSRALVHRERGRADAVLTGIGTIVADDPRLTARSRRPRRTPRRIVIDAEAMMPLESKIVRTALDVPTTILVDEEHLSRDRCAALRERGVDVRGMGTGGGLRAALIGLATEHDLTTILVESGGGLLGRLFAEDLVAEAWVFIAPLLFGDEEAAPCVRGLQVPTLSNASRFHLLGVHRRGADVLLRYARSADGKVSSRARTRPG